jgi:hypothetical protein
MMRLKCKQRRITATCEQRAGLVQPEASSHPICRERSSELASGCTRFNSLLVRLIREKSCERSRQAGQDLSRGVLGAVGIDAIFLQL